MENSKFKSLFKPMQTLSEVTQSPLWAYLGLYVPMYIY